MKGFAKSTLPLPLQAKQDSCLLCMAPCLLAAPTRGRFAMPVLLLALSWPVITALASRGSQLTQGKRQLQRLRKSLAAPISGEERGEKQRFSPGTVRLQQRMLKGPAGSRAAALTAFQGTGRVAAASPESTPSLFPSQAKKNCPKGAFLSPAAQAADPTCCSKSVPICRRTGTSAFLAV